MKKILITILFSFICLNASSLEKADDAYSKKEFKKAFKLYEQACIEKDNEGCFKVGFMYENKQKVKQDYKKAFEFYDKSCSFGNARGCYKIAVAHDKGGIVEVKQDFKIAEEYYKKSCENGYELGCYNLGSLYQYSLDPEKNVEKAKSMFIESCKKGQLLGCYKAAHMYEKEENYNDAAAWYKEGCDRRDTQACFRLTDLIIKKIIMDIDPKDYKDYYKKYDKACKNDDALMCYSLGVFHSTGRGTRQNYTKAKDAFGKGCDLGDNASCMEFGMLLDMGF